MSPTAALLVCRLSALGDVVLTLPAVHALRRRFPDARLEYLSRRPNERILRDVSALDGVHGWEGPGAELPAGVQERSWSVVIDLSGSGRSRRLLAGVKRERLLRVRKQPLRRLAYVYARRFGADGRGIVPAVERMLATVAPLGIDVSDTRPDLGVGPPPDEGPVLLAPGAGRPTKCWPAERFAALARRVAEEDGRDLLVVGGGDEKELTAAVAEAAGLRGRAVAGGDPAELPGLVAGCSVAVTNDSALLHVAEACGVPVVALFGPTRPPLGFGPRGERSIALTHATDCSPCDLHGPRRCPREHHRCLREIDVATVLTAVRSRLPVRAES